MNYEDINDSGYANCSDCGKHCHADDLNVDWLCADCEKQHCAFCLDKYPVSELVEDHEIGMVCEQCAKELTEKRTDKFLHEYQKKQIALLEVPGYYRIAN